ncbi:methyltransferase domain-containing protein [Microdochium trichocladiopsis]|uniref:Methyltransferase domain-containing protein n=1 Tax=Microdochium trichocladiopsis TaxID=1682393 RepID=A0A9P8YAM2_9PEZI|nr:methyltransferase domain-containing protein [Microdochium trichocladiopsis]KAH7034988.1 methyltransferase domain-containing protein [Microdochium trichocladiopsis]
MLPTPDTSHVSYERIYEPAEDSFLLLDTLSSESEKTFLTNRFRDGPTPHVIELGPGSGVVISFVNAHAGLLFGTPAILSSAIDVNGHACFATAATARKAAAEHKATAGTFLGPIQGNLSAPLRAGSVDVLIFNPPYVPTPELPRQPGQEDHEVMVSKEKKPTFDDDSYLLSLSYAGGRDGMETTDRFLEELPHVLSPRGCCYLLLCAQNKPEEVKERIRGYGSAWKAETVGSSGKTAGWEKLQVVRIWR